MRKLTPAEQKFSLYISTLKASKMVYADVYKYTSAEIWKLANDRFGPDAVYGANADDPAFRIALIFASAQNVNTVDVRFTGGGNQSTALIIQRLANVARNFTELELVVLYNLLTRASLSLMRNKSLVKSPAAALTRIINSDATFNQDFDLLSWSITPYNLVPDFSEAPGNTQVITEAHFPLDIDANTLTYANYCAIDGSPKYPKNQGLPISLCMFFVRAIRTWHLSRDGGGYLNGVNPAQADLDQYYSDMLDKCQLVRHAYANAGAAALEGTAIFRNNPVQDMELANAAAHFHLPANVHGVEGFVTLFLDSFDNDVFIKNIEHIHTIGPMDEMRLKIAGYYLALYYKVIYSIIGGDDEIPDGTPATLRLNLHKLGMPLGVANTEAKAKKAAGIVQELQSKIAKALATGGDAKELERARLYYKDKVKLWWSLNQHRLSLLRANEPGESVFGTTFFSPSTYVDDAMFV
jgi:hypothetical protein